VEGCRIWAASILDSGVCIDSCFTATCSSLRLPSLGLRESDRFACNVFPGLQDEFLAEVQLPGIV